MNRLVWPALLTFVAVPCTPAVILSPFCTPLQISQTLDVSYLSDRYQHKPPSTLGLLWTALSCCHTHPDFIFPFLISPRNEKLGYELSNSISLIIPQKSVSWRGSYVIEEVEGSGSPGNRVILDKSLAFLIYEIRANCMISAIVSPSPQGLFQWPPRSTYTTIYF